MSIKISNDWISASKTKNFAMNDPLLDYLEKKNITNLKINKKIKKSKKLKKPKNQKTFLNYILNEGLIFEDLIYNKLKKNLIIK